MEDYLAILQALKWAASRCKYSDVSTLGIKRLQEVFINFEETPASNIEPLKYEMGGTEILSFVYTGYSQSRITITPALPFIVYMYDGKSLFGSESNCSKDVINFLCKNKQTRTISFNAPQNIVNKEQKPHVYIRNKMSARELICSENATLKFVENPNTGKVFFTCGSKKGYVSPAALEHMEQGELDDFHYAEVSMDGKTYVPCLMLVNKPTEKIIRSFDVKNDNITEKRYGLQPCSISKKLEIKRQLYSLMLHFIQTEYGDISVTAENIDDLNILSIPLANARTCYEDNESFIHTCNLYGLDYSEILDEVSKQIIDYYMRKNKQEDTDLPF